MKEKSVDHSEIAKFLVLHVVIVGSPMRELVDLVYVVVELSEGAQACILAPAFKFKRNLSVENDLHSVAIFTPHVSCCFLETLV